VLLILSAAGVAIAEPASDPFTLLDAAPSPPANVTAAGLATRISDDGSGPLLEAPACNDEKTRIIASARPSGSAAGIDMGRASSDPAYAAQIQARMQSMSMAEKMAMAQQMSAAQQREATGSGGAIVAFVGNQRSADMVAQQKIRALVEGALSATGARHRSVDDALNAAAKSCATDKTGFPLKSCTGPLTVKAIAQHRSIEDASLGAENQALAQARSIALAEMNKGRDLLAHASGTSGSSLRAWAMVYVQLLNDYATVITLRAGFWAHADGTDRYTGQISPYIHVPGGELYWPLNNAAYPTSIRVGL
jgi:hypothetical protein